MRYFVRGPNMNFFEKPFRFGMQVLQIIFESIHSYKEEDTAVQRSDRIDSFWFANCDSPQRIKNKIKNIFIHSDSQFI